RFRPLRLWWRPDRVRRPATLLPTRLINQSVAWSEDPSDRNYNRPVVRSASEPSDRLWRGDGLYDLFIEIDHNVRPRVAGRGSAVFIHVARPGFAPTAGCVALRRSDLLRLSARIGPKTRITIHNSPSWPAWAGRAPKMAVPTRTCVAPNAIAVRKSAL